MQAARDKPTEFADHALICYIQVVRLPRARINVNGCFIARTFFGYDINHAADSIRAVKSRTASLNNLNPFDHFYRRNTFQIGLHRLSLGNLIAYHAPPVKQKQHTICAIHFNSRSKNHTQIGNNDAVDVTESLSDTLIMIRLNFFCRYHVNIGGRVPFVCRDTFGGEEIIFQFQIVQIVDVGFSLNSSIRLSRKSQSCGKEGR